MNKQEMQEKVEWLETKLVRLGEQLEGIEDSWGDHHCSIVEARRALRCNAKALTLPEVTFDWVCPQCSSPGPHKVHCSIDDLMSGECVECGSRREMRPHDWEMLDALASLLEERKKPRNGTLDGLYAALWEKRFGKRP